jgi:thioredoxin 1
VLVIDGIWFFKNAGTADFGLETEAVDLEALTAYGLPLIIDFGSDSCIPCQEMAPVLKKMNVEMQGKAIIKFVDVWKHPGAADDFPVQVIPTQVFINADGTPYVPSNDIGIKLTLYSYRDTGEHAFTAHQGGLTEEQMRTILADIGVER